MTMTVGEFRREVDRLRGSRRRGAVRYPEALVMFAVAHVRRVRASGASMNAVATELGVSAMTLSTWLLRGQGHLREVVVSSSPRVESAELTVSTPSGHVVRGLNVLQAAALLRALT